MKELRETQDRGDTYGKVNVKNPSFLSVLRIGQLKHGAKLTIAK